MGLYTKLPAEIQEVDIIIAGGGTAGCVIATRLAEADPGLSVLVIEGGSNNDAPTIATPVFFISSISPGSSAVTFYKGKRSEHLLGREPIVPSGAILGGGSSTNFMMYSRAQRTDFDSWEAEGWSSEDILPYLKKSETYHGPEGRETHGYNGPLQISRGPFQSSRVESDFIAAAGKLGYPELDDLMNLDDTNGVQRAFRFVSPEGKRQDTASVYLHPKLQDGVHPNLHVLLDTQVVRILFDNNNKRASGVEYVAKESSESAPLTEQPTKKVLARKMVISCCGALGTPLVLERSGLGDPEILKRAGIPLTAALPGVGYGYEDHQLLVSSYKSSLAPEETLDGLAGGRVDPGKLFKNNNPVLGWNCQDVACKIRPSDADVASFQPEVREAWNRDFQNNKKPLALMALIAAFTGDPTSIPAGQYFSVSTFTVYPYSRGHVHISGHKLSDAPDFDPGFFSDPSDIDLKYHMWVYKKQREIVRRMENYRGELAIAHPAFPAGSKAACIETDGPLTDVQDLEYTAEDDAAIEKWARENVGTTWHSLGTCKMAPLEKAGVVDSRLGVYGVQGLKIADLSIVPSNVGANTCNTALTIAEKAAALFIEELGLGRK